jgi:hypothetical protein
MLTFLFCAVAAMAWLFPDTPAGRRLRRLLVDLPARKLSQLTAGGVIFALLVVLAVAAAIALARTDGILLAAQGLPDGIAWFAAFDVATYLDVIALAWLLAAMVRLRAAYDGLRALAAQVRGLARRWITVLRVRGRPGARTRSRHAGAKPPRPPRDEEPGWSTPAFSYS